ncbi:MAG: hydrogenase maturation protease [Fimbriimonas sp.]|nr:hydrogenase maturation protease [Fimbriimonas sp.]
MRVTVIGFGSRDRGDDGVGIEVIERLSEGLPECAKALTCDPARLIDNLPNCGAVILVDACLGLGEPGSVHVVNHVPEQQRSTTTHGVSISEALGLVEALGGVRLFVCVVLIEGAIFDLGQPMSLEVSRSIPHAADIVREQARRMAVVSGLG